MLVRPKQAFVSVLAEVPEGVTLGPGDRLRDDNPHVRARPDMFEQIESNFVGYRNSDVEETTSKPGERRNR